MKKLTTNQIRQIWIDYFKSKDHYVLESKPLIPINDPSLLWINSGVATLKPYFSGVTNPPHARLVNSQRAIRTNDILNVGVTARHHTFFEMLGNFAIGDYFKKEAIDYAFDLLINHYGMDRSLLYITVYEEDIESYQLWIKKGIDPKHITKGNRDRNFWDIGQGPCGPCTEIFYDRGIKYDPQQKGVKLFYEDIENDRYVEIWNIVFSQFNNDGQGHYTELKRKNIDTGAGLERLASISQDVPTDFDIDIFKPSIEAISKLTKKQYSLNGYFDNNQAILNVNRDYKIMVDHIKTCTFAIADGALPSGKDRGSVLRRLLRRAMIAAKRLEINVLFSEVVVKTIVETMSGAYPLLSTHQKHIIDVLIKEEQLFAKTLNNGLKLFDELIKDKSLNDANIFKLVETYGFPFEIINELANEKGIKISETSFQKHFEAHQKVSKANQDIKGMSQQNQYLMSFTTSSKFHYDKTSLNSASVIALFDETFQPIDRLSNKGWVVFNETVFYATSGGQQHDEGYITFGKDKIKVLDVIKGPNGQHLHLVDLKDITLKINDVCAQAIDELNRLNIARNHSVEHLIQKALQTVIDPTIRQEGAFKSAQKVTFDFRYAQKLSDEQIVQLQDEVNKYIHQAIVVDTKLMTLEEAKQFGAIAWFSDVYTKIKDKLRVVCMGETSKEICGGTHIANTKDIEQFMVISIDNKGGGAWRLEGMTSHHTINTFLTNEIGMMQTNINQMHQELNQNKIDSKEFNALMKEVDYEISSANWLKLKKQLVVIQGLFNKLMYEANKNKSLNELQVIKQLPRKINEKKKLIILEYATENNKVVNQALTELVNEDKEHAYVLLNKTKVKIQYIVGASKEFVDTNKFNASLLIQELNKLSSGSGGGKNTFAQGGTVNFENYSKIFEFLLN